jgi:hypothetical protein
MELIHLPAAPLIGEQFLLPDKRSGGDKVRMRGILASIIADSWWLIADSSRPSQAVESDNGLA